MYQKTCFEHVCVFYTRSMKFRFILAVKLSTPVLNLLYYICFIIHRLIGLILRRLLSEKFLMRVACACFDYEL